MGTYRDEADRLSSEEYNRPPRLGVKVPASRRFIELAANVIIGGAVTLFVLGVIAVGRLVFG